MSARRKNMLHRLPRTQQERRENAAPEIAWLVRAKRRPRNIVTALDDLDYSRSWTPRTPWRKGHKPRHKDHRRGL
jgi:hypothetical protein